MHFFVTGSTGFIGSNFVNRALLNGHKVTALARNKSKPKIRLIKEPIWCRGELYDDWSNYLSKCDVFVHFAAAGVVNNYQNWEKCFDVNCIHFEILLRNAFKSGIEKFLICGSCFEYGSTGNEYKKIPIDAELKPIGAYSYSKALAGLSALNFAKKNNLRLILARLFYVYGKGEHPNRFWPSLVNAAIQGKDFKMTKGEQLRNFTNVEDSALSLLEVCETLKSIKSGGIIRNIGSEYNGSLKEFAYNEWEKLNAKGSIHTGYYSYRDNEVMSYVPDLFY